MQVVDGEVGPDFSHSSALDPRVDSALLTNDIHASFVRVLSHRSYDNDTSTSVSVVSTHKPDHVPGCLLGDRRFRGVSCNPRHDAVLANLLVASQVTSSVRPVLRPSSTKTWTSAAMLPSRRRFKIQGLPGLRSWYVHFDGFLRKRIILMVQRFTQGLPFHAQGLLACLVRGGSQSHSRTSPSKPQGFLVL
jgi:hypothetical protein